MLYYTTMVKSCTMNSYNGRPFLKKAYQIQILMAIWPNKFHLALYHTHTYTHTHTHIHPHTHTHTHHTHTHTHIPHTHTAHTHYMYVFRCSRFSTLSNYTHTNTLVFYGCMVTRLRHMRTSYWQPRGVCVMTTCSQCITQHCMHFIS